MRLDALARLAVPGASDVVLVVDLAERRGGGGAVDGGAK